MIGSRVISLFGKELEIKSYVCSAFGGEEVQDSKLNLYIMANGYCNVKCLFCNGYSSTEAFDYDKLREVLRELRKQDLLNRISLTGGEPMLNIKRFDRILQVISEECPEYHVSVNTNGTTLTPANLEKMQYLHVLNDVHLSRHHYDDWTNGYIFGSHDVPTTAQIKELSSGPLQGKLSMSCNLIKGMIGTKEKVLDYMQFAAEVGAYFVGFVSLMEKNGFCKAEFIDYEEISRSFKIADHMVFDVIRKDGDTCKCENWDYVSSSGTVVPFYMRRVIKPSCDCIKSFTYTENNQLTANFKGMQTIY